MIRCDTCLIALQIADREDNNCPSCKDYRIPLEHPLVLANARASVKNQKFQEEWQEEQAKDIEEMDRLGLDHPFKTKKRIEDDDYQERGLHRSFFIDNEFI